MITITKYDHCETPPRVVRVQRRGVLYDLGGETVELFRIKVLAEALDRTRETLLEWERNGILPRPLFRVLRPSAPPGAPPSRYYSATQITNAHRLAQARTYRGGVLTRRADLTSFARELRAVWYVPGVVVDVKGSVIGSRSPGFGAANPATPSDSILPVV